MPLSSRVSLFLLAAQFGCAFFQLYLLIITIYRNKKRPLGTLRMSPSNGPMTTIQIEVSGRTISGWALVDTGASHTVLDESAIRSLGALSSGSVPTTCFRGTERAEALYSKITVRLLSAPRPAFHYDVIPALNLRRSDSYYLGIVGRDILQKCTLSIKGDRVTLS